MTGTAIPRWAAGLVSAVSIIAVNCDERTVIPVVLVVSPIDSPENEMLASCAGRFSVRVTRATRRLTAASE